MRSLLFHALLVSTALLGLNSSIKSQSVAEFELLLYFEDARGNRDTVIIGYDSLASIDLDEFDSRNILTPFDSVFEVRVAVKELFGNSNELTKKMIIRKESPPSGIPGLCGGPYEEYYIFIRNKYPPFTMRWDHQAFRAEPCLWSSFFAWDQSNVLLGTWWLQTQKYECLASADSISLELKKFEWGNYYLKSIGGVPTDTIWGFRVVFQPPRPGLMPCENAVTSVRPLEQHIKWDIYPNPGSYQLTITFNHTTIPIDDPYQLVIRDLLGQELYTKELSKIYFNPTVDLDLGILPPGNYLVALESRRGSVYGVKKWVKLE